MLNVGVPEMLLILFVALIVFGPNRLPEIARSMGKFIRSFQNETNRAISDLKAGIEPVTHGVFDTPDAGSEPAAAFIPAEEMSQAKTRTRSSTTRRPAPKRRSTTKTRGASTRRSPAKQRSASTRSRPAAARSRETAKRSPKTK